MRSLKRRLEGDQQELAGGGLSNWLRHIAFRTNVIVLLKLPTPIPEIAAGQLAYLKEEQSKHSARPLYVVTSVTSDNLAYVKKVFYFHSTKPGKYQNVEHTVKLTDLIPASSGKARHDSDDIDVLEELRKVVKKVPKQKKKLIIPVKTNQIEAIQYTYNSTEDECEEIEMIQEDPNDFEDEEADISNDGEEVEIGHVSQEDTHF